MKHDLVSINDLTITEVEQILDQTKKLKEYKGRASDHLKGKNIGLLFQKPSNRTRVSFEVGINQLGANCIYLGPDEINLGVRESTTDVSKTLSRYLDCIIARTHSHKDIVELTKNSDIPIINGLSDLYHPCQGLTDIFSIREKFGNDSHKILVAYIGDGNNVCHSLLLACAKVGMDINVATPKGYEPDPKVIKLAEVMARETGTKIEIGYNPKVAAKKAHVLYSDVWVSMGQEDETDKRLNDFSDYQINAEIAELADENYIFMHCLPAHRGQEVTSEVIDSEHSIIFDQAENRLHTQKAIMIFLMEKR